MLRELDVKKIQHFSVDVSKWLGEIPNEFVGFDYPHSVVMLYDKMDENACINWHDAIESLYGVKCEIRSVTQLPKLKKLEVDDYANIGDSLCYQNDTVVVNAVLEYGNYDYGIKIYTTGSIRVGYEGIIYKDNHKMPQRLLDMFRTGEAYYSDKVDIQDTNYWELEFRKMCKNGDVIYHDYDMLDFNPNDFVNDNDLMMFIVETCNYRHDYDESNKSDNMIIQNIVWDAEQKTVDEAGLPLAYSIPRGKSVNETMREIFGFDVKSYEIYED